MWRGLLHRALRARLLWLGTAAAGNICSGSPGPGTGGTGFSALMPRAGRGAVGAGQACIRSRARIPHRANVPGRADPTHGAPVRGRGGALRWANLSGRADLSFGIGVCGRANVSSWAGVSGRAGLSLGGSIGR